MRNFVMAFWALALLFGGLSVVSVQSASAASAKEKGAGGGSEYVQIDHIILPIIDKNGVSQTVSMVLAIEVKNASGASKVKSMEPKLKDAFIQDMYGVLNKHAALKGGVIQVGYIKERLKRVSAEVMGDDTITDVLLQFVQQRPV